MNFLQTVITLRRTKEATTAAKCSFERKHGLNTFETFYGGGRGRWETITVRRQIHWLQIKVVAAFGSDRGYARKSMMSTKIPLEC